MFNIKDVQIKMQMFKNSGITKNKKFFTKKNSAGWYYEQQTLGMNYRMTDFQAALGLSQLDRLSGFIAKRLSCTGRYESALGEKNSFMRQTAVGPGLANGYRFALKLGSNLANAEKLMLDKGITCIRPIIPEELLHRCLDLSPSDFPCAESVAANTLSFPIFPSLSEDQIIRIVDGLTELKDSIDSRDHKYHL